MKILKNIKPNNGITFSSSDLFTPDKKRFVVKITRKKYFEIFPWFFLPQKQKYRDTISPEACELIVEALTIFWSGNLTESDFLFF